MIALIQRVSQARVRVAGDVAPVTVGEIGAGLLALVCAERDDGERECDALLVKLLGYRVFADDAGRMNRSLRDAGGGLLVVPQFTLVADTNSGTRPSFTPAAAPETGRVLYERFVAAARRQHPVVAEGRFGAMMQVELVNDGPVTFWLQVQPRRSAQ
jgi:D-aminoacyl-tRNA deacylase